MTNQGRRPSKARGAYRKLWKLWYAARIFLIGGTIAGVALAARQPVMSAVIGGATLLFCAIAVRSPMRWSPRARVLDLTPSRAPKASEPIDAWGPLPEPSEPWRDDLR